jgi:ElaB/YqjD/DUF883 family membrane-anchored ribosome-binding protein
MDQTTEIDAPRGWPESGAEQFVRAEPASASSRASAVLDYVRSNPGKTILVCAAIGVVLGRLLRRL